MAPSANGTGCGNAPRRAAIHSRFAARNRRPTPVGTLRGKTSSTLPATESMRTATRRARRLTRIETGAPIVGSQCESIVFVPPLCLLNVSPDSFDLAKGNRTA